MKKMYVLFLLVCVVSLSMQAQKLQGKVSCLKGESEINLIFDYEGMTIDGDVEKEYVAEKMESMTQEEAQKWKDDWYGKFRKEIYQEEFIKFFNTLTVDIKLKGGCFETAAYTIVVKITDLDPGNFAGPFSNPSKISGEAYLVKTGDKTVIATISFKKTHGNLNPVFEYRIGSAIGYLGRVIGKILVKNI